MERSEWAAIRRGEVWQRYGRGETTVAIGRSLGVSPRAIYKILRRRGGIRPPGRHRSARVLSSAEREEISRQLACGHSLRAIAAQLARAPSTISREVRRHGGRAQYRGQRA